MTPFQKESENNPTVASPDGVLIHRNPRRYTCIMIVTLTKQHELVFIPGRVLKKVNPDLMCTCHSYIHHIAYSTIYKKEKGKKK